MIPIIFIFAILFGSKQCSAFLDISVDQAVNGFGFHRVIEANITLYGNLTCTFMIDEKFSKNWHIREYELEKTCQSYKLFKRLSLPVEEEAIASAAQPFVISLYPNGSAPVTLSLEFGKNFVYRLPIHVRYQDPQPGGGRREFKKAPFALYANCLTDEGLPKTATISAPCGANDGICSYKQLPYSQKQPFPPVSVPVGDTNMYQIVFLSTHITAYIGVFVLLYSILMTSIIP